MWIQKQYWDQTQWKLYTQRRNVEKIENKSKRDGNMDTETVLGPNTMEVIHTEKKCRKNRE